MDYSRYIPIVNSLIWPQLLHFNIGENWGDYEKMDVRLLWDLDGIRHDLARKIRVKCAYELSGHADKSFHKLGMAVDFSIEDTGKSELYDLYTYLLMMWRGGVGVYPFWNTPGFHLDIGPDRTWVRDKEGVYHSESDKMRDVIMLANL